MKRKRHISNQKSNKIKRPSAVLLIVFGSLILLFAAFIFLGIKAGEYAAKEKANESSAGIYQIYTEEIL